MRATLLLATVVSGIAAASALADGPGAPGTGTTNSVFSPRSNVMYTAAAHKSRTNVTIWHNGRKLRSTSIHGSFGVPVPTNEGVGEGISHDGRTLVLAWEGGPTSVYPILDGSTLAVRRVVKLEGAFSYDALSPDGRTLYLIQYQSLRPGAAAAHYYVRAYDVVRGRLWPQIVFDVREKRGPMTGMPWTRVSGPSGRWVYTLYVRTNGTAFVHALDTIDRHAYCVDFRLPSPSAMYHLRLRLHPGRLNVRDGTKLVAAIDTKTLRVTR